MTTPTVYLAADHRGFALKEEVKNHFHSLGFTVIDCGNTTPDPQDDYPVFAIKAGRQIASNPQSVGILFCGSGIGMCIGANRIKGVRCALVKEREDVIKGKEEDNINALAIAADTTTKETVLELFTTLLQTSAKQEEKYLRREKELDTID